MSLHDCFKNIVFESAVFVCAKNLTLTPGNNLCVLCERPVSKDTDDTRIPYCCEGVHARPLKGCLHWVHVGCQMNINKDVWKCPVCSHDLKSEISIGYNNNGVKERNKLKKAIEDDIRLVLGKVVTYEYLTEIMTSIDLLNEFSSDDVDYWKRRNAEFESYKASLSSKVNVKKEVCMLVDSIKDSKFKKYLRETHHLV